MAKFWLLFTGITLLINQQLAYVAEAPRLNITIRTDNKDDFEAGTPRVLACITIGCAPSLNVTWYLGDVMLRPNVYKEVSRGNFTVSSLTFVPSLTDNGKELVCRATNGDLSQFSEDRVTIRVGQRPKCVDRTYKTIRAVEGESQTLACIVDSDPDPEQFLWSFPSGRTLYTSSKKVPGHESRYSSALVWVPHKDDYGPVHCRAFNRLGDQKQPCTFSVENGVPSTPDCSVDLESQEINSPCGKNDVKSVFPSGEKTGGSPPQEEKMSPYLIITALMTSYVFIVVLIIIALDVCPCSRCIHRVSRNVDDSNNNNELRNIRIERDRVNRERAEIQRRIENHPCRVSTTPCEGPRSTHKHEYCV